MEYKYSVLFEHINISVYVVIAKDLCLESAVSLAFKLHNFSNTDHVISVCRQDVKGNVSIFEFSKK